MTDQQHGTVGQGWGLPPYRVRRLVSDTARHFPCYVEEGRQFSVVGLYPDRYSR